MTAEASLVAPPGLDASIAVSPGDALIERLDDPALASSLAVILDHADLIATLIEGLDGLIRRGDVIGDSVVSSLADFRELGASLTAQKLLPGVDVAGLKSTASELTMAMIDLAPTINQLLHSPLTDPQTVGILTDVGSSLLEGKAAADEDPRGPKGVFGLMKVVKDPDVSRGLGFMIHIARAFGKRLAPEATRPDERAPRHAADK